jgi:hypothetical protein
MFYTYAHYKPNNSVFYIGKGRGRRAWSIKDRNPHWQNVVAKHGGHKVEVLAKWSTEQEAFDHEKFLIWCFRDMGYSMANITDGGDGVSGYTHTPETKKILSSHHKRLHNLPEQKAKNSKRNKLRMQDPCIKNHVRAGAIQYMASFENREKSRQAAIVQNSSQEFRQKQRERCFIRMQQPKYRLLMAKACVCVETGQIFQSQADAARWVGLHAKSQTINKAISGKLKTAYGYHWQSANKE